METKPFPSLEELKTHLENSGWAKIKTWEANMRPDVTEHWYKRDARFTTPCQENKGKGVQLCLKIYTPPEHPTSNILTLGITAKKHDEEWVNMEIYSMSPNDLSEKYLDQQIGQIAAGWNAMNSTPTLPERPTHFPDHTGKLNKIEYPKGSTYAIAGNVVLIQQSAKKFAVIYGLQITKDMTTDEAAKEFGRCVIHQAGCAGAKTH